MKEGTAYKPQRVLRATQSLILPFTFIVKQETVQLLNLLPIPFGNDRGEIHVEGLPF